MRTRINGIASALAAAGILCMGSNLPAGHGHGGGGGGHMGGGHHGGGFGGGGHHFGGGGFGGGGHHFGGGSSHHFGGGGGSGFGGARHYSAPQHHFSAPQGGGGLRHSHSLGGTTHQGHQFNGGARGGFQGGHHQPSQPSFSARHAGSNIATHHRGVGGATNGLSGAGSHSRHLSANGGGAGNNFLGRHQGHQAGATHSNLAGTGNSIAARHGGNFVGQHSGHRTGGAAGQGGNFVARHGGHMAHQGGSANLAARTGSMHNGHAGRNSIATGAIGANSANGRVHTVNAHQMWNQVGRGVGNGLSSFHRGHYGHLGTAAYRGGLNYARHGYGHGYHGYYGNSFRYNRLYYGFGTGFWPYYAWNYRPFWGGGYGWGGWGSGWRFSFGYPGFAFGFGSPWYGYGYGLGGYGLGYGGYGWGGGYGGYGYNSYCNYTPGYSVYSNGYAYVPNTSSAFYGSAPVSTAYAVGNTAPSQAPVQIAQVDPNQPTVRAQSADDDLDFGAAGEAEFKAGNYEKAAKYWKHAVLDDPKNGVLVMMLAQGLFASGKFDEAAGATQQGMLLLKEEDWGVVISNYRELYTKIGDYTTQLRALEKSRKDKPEDPGLRFLLGFHYGYLGFPTEATRELEKATSLAPQDELAKRLKVVLDAKLKKTDSKTVTVQPPEPGLQTVPKKQN